MNRPALVLLLAVATFALAPVARAGRTRAVCPYAAGALPVETLPAGRPHGDQIPIDHIVVLMQENRSFDHMFGKLFEEGQPNAAGLRGIHANPDPLGTHVISSFHQTRYCEVADLAHSWSRTHAEWNGGLMNGFPAANAVSADPHGSRAMGYYTSADLPFYYALYATFAMGDHYFASVLGPTYPNRLYLLAGTSFGHTSNDAPSPRDEYSPSIFDRMNAAGVDWRVYYGGLPFSAFLSGAAARPANLDPIDQFYADAAAGMLPPVSFVEPAYFGGLNEENDEHPPANVQVGQQFVAGVVQALFASPNWPHTAMFLTYDEHGGFYDHVPPPPACIPDDKPPRNQTGAFDHYGIRVPMVAISPYARPGFVSHDAHDHTSILRFIETRFDLPALTARDANAKPLFEFFDFDHPAFLTPPTLPEATIDPVRAAECEAQ